METRQVDGWTRHFACCEPVEVGSKYPYCVSHDPFIST